MQAKVKLFIRPFLVIFMSAGCSVFVAKENCFVMLNCCCRCDQFLRRLLAKKKDEASWKEGRMAQLCKRVRHQDGLGGETIKDS